MRFFTMPCLYCDVLPSLLKAQLFVGSLLIPGIFNEQTLRHCSNNIVHDIEGYKSLIARPYESVNRAMPGSYYSDVERTIYVSPLRFFVFYHRFYSPLVSLLICSAAYLRDSNRRYCEVRWIISRRKKIYQLWVLERKLWTPARLWWSCVRSWETIRDCK